MKKKLIQLLFLMLPFLCSSQEYIDLFSINYGKSQKTTFDNRSENTTISTFQTNITLPFVLNEKYTIISGVNFARNSLQLFPDSNYNHLYSTTLKAGVRINHSEHWSGIYVLLPKVASDYINVSHQDFYFGGVALWKYKRDKNFGYTLGLYSSKEAFGLSLSPVLGLYYHSQNSRFEMNFFLPNDADINYSLTDNIKIGTDFLGHGNSFKLTTDNVRSTYVENNTLEFSSYLQHSLFNKQMLLRLKMGYSFNRYDIYPIDQKLDLQILGLKFGDNRTELFRDSSSSLFFKIESIYRFDLGKVKK